MKYINKIIIAVFYLMAFCSCMDEDLSPLIGTEYTNADMTTGSANDNSRMKLNQAKITGTVQIDWIGGRGSGMVMGNQPGELLAFAELEAFEPAGGLAVKGSFIYRVLNIDLTPHREVTAIVTGVFIDEISGKSWIVGKVVSDTKGCSGNGTGGHETGCDAGSCDSHDADGHDDSCSGSDGMDHTDGGCSGSEHEDGGCSGGSDMHDGGSGTSGGGCSGTEHADGCSGNHGDEESGGMQDDNNMGNPLKGKNCRIGQVIAIKCHDSGTPGVEGDGITWKWFSSSGPFVPAISNRSEWPHLCKKTIIEGNLLIHKR